MFLAMCLSADYGVFISIVDDSLSDPFDKLKCMVFAPDTQSLPDAKIGDIVRFHRLKVTTLLILYQHYHTLA